ncbi:MAG: type II toxin-antitoxin system VapC family toxin [Deltaproteobacteria bacterium]|nr:type II toxin-antitoxin system VapC family toxin [Deltaproteobacteria bacterium]
MKLESLPSGSLVFIDANIFIYYFTGTSPSCHQLLIRCSSAELRGVTSLPVLLEVAHRLMVVEARQKRLVRGANPVQKLARSPALVKKLSLYQEWTLAIPRMGIEVEEVTFADFMVSMGMRQKSGLLTLDALILAVMSRLKIPNLASADQAFSEVEGIKLLSPSDIHSS